jgi:hypothetical protein
LIDFKDWHTIFETGMFAFQNNSTFLFAVFLLTFIQTGFEVIKWRYATAKIGQISWKNAIKSIFLGNLLSLILPFGFGNASGKMLFLEKKINKQAFFVLFVCGFWQNVGAISTIFLFLAINGDFTFLLVSLIICFIFLYVSNFIHAFEKIKTYFELLKGKHFLLFLVSLGRHWIYVLQYFLLLRALNVKIPTEKLFLSISYILGAKTLFPFGNFLATMSLRENFALWILGNEQIKIPQILLAGLFIWFLNHILTALIGLMMTQNFDYFKSQK